MRALVLVAILAAASMAGNATDERTFRLDPEDVVAGRLALPDGTVLLVAPHDVRADGFRALARDGDGAVVVDVAPHLFAGSVEGVPDSWAVVSASPEGVLAAWAGPEGPIRLVAPRAYLVGGPADGAHVFVESLPETAIDEGGLEVPDDGRENGAGLPPSAAAPRAARAAIDVDYEFWRFHSCVFPLLDGACPPTAERWAVLAEHLVGVLDVVFHRQTGVRLEVESLHAWRSTAAPYPYPTAVTPAALDVLLAARDHWEGVAPTTSHPRDLLHVLSGRHWVPPTIGIAYVGAVESSYAYGASSTPSWNQRHYTLVAHEVGHNFDGVHAEATARTPALTVLGQGPALRTIMWPTICTCYEFSDGTEGPAYDNAARIRAHAADRVR